MFITTQLIAQASVGSRRVYLQPQNFWYSKIDFVDVRVFRHRQDTLHYRVIHNVYIIQTKSLGRKSTCLSPAPKFWYSKIVFVDVRVFRHRQDTLHYRVIHNVYIIQTKSLGRKSTCLSPAPKFWYSKIDFVDVRVFRHWHSGTQYTTYTIYKTT